MSKNIADEKICRLCLRTIIDDYKTLTEEISTEISNVLFLYLNFDINDSPVICKMCKESLQNTISFRAAMKMLPRFYSNNDEVVQYFHKLCAEETTTSESNKSYKDMKACHFCLKFSTNSRYLPEVNHNTFLLEMLHQLCTELKINFNEDPVACDKCFNYVQDILQFTSRCLNSEEKIRTFVAIEGTNSNYQIDLNDVQKFQCKSSYKWDSIDKGGIEEEKYLRSEVTCDENKIKVEVKSENCIVLTVNDLEVEEATNLEQTVEDFANKEVNIKNEEVVIKSEDDFNSLVEYKMIQGSKMLVCKLCSYMSKYRFCVVRHMLRHKSKSEVELFNCTECTFTTKYKDGLSKHMIIHKDADQVKIYKCDKCPFETKHKYGTVKHALIHKNPTEVIMFKCSICTYEAKRKEHLKKHMLIHAKAGLPKYKCDQCRYKTVRKDNLETHMLIHKDASEVPMFKCDLCFYKTRIKGSLKSHVRTHRNKVKKTWRRCTLCEYKSKYEGHIKRHLRLKHDVDVMEKE